MKRVLILCLALLPYATLAQTQKPATLRSMLLEGLRTTHSEKDWFVPVNVALEGLTPEQASWKDSSGNHSVGQLANHLLFWNQRELAKLKGQLPAKFSGENDETFNGFDAKSWAETVQKLDKVLTELEQLVEKADDAKVQEWASDLSHIATHNAYHTGQIIYARKQHGTWDPAKGVK
jgi:uncharacterized damage-inducible protein DinB